MDMHLIKAMVRQRSGAQQDSAYCICWILWVKHGIGADGQQIANNVFQYGRKDLKVVDAEKMLL